MLNFQEPIKQVIVSSSLVLILASALTIYKFILKKKLNLFVVLILVSIIPIVSIFRAGTYESGDLTLHSVYLQSFYENLKNGILIPQWAGGLCGGYGCPIFMFEYTLPFYIGAIFHFIGFSFLYSMKLFLAFSFIVSGITMYIFIKDEHGKTAAFVASILYLFAPVHLTEMHFRVSVGIISAFMFIPLIFLFVKKSLEGKSIYIILNAITFLLLILSHSSITFVIVPLSIAYAFFRKKKLKEIIYPLLSFMLGLGISSFYVLPALFEIQYTWYSQTIKSVNEFYPFYLYLFSPARFGLLFQGNNGELRLIVGYAQIIIVIIAAFSLFKGIYKKHEKNITLFLLLSFLICFTLMLSFTKSFWDNILFLRSFVLPWRMLIPIAFIAAYLGAIVTKNWNKKLLIFFCIFIIASTILNWGNRKMVPLDQNAYNSQWVLYTEYFDQTLPIYISRYNSRVLEQPKLVLNRPTKYLEIIAGEGSVEEIYRTQIDHEYSVYAKTKLQLSENTYYFPGWKTYVNGKETVINIRNNKKFGTLSFNLEKGKYLISTKFEDTGIRIAGKLISFIAILGIIFIFINALIKHKLNF